MWRKANTQHFRNIYSGITSHMHLTSNSILCGPQTRGSTAWCLLLQLLEKARRNSSVFLVSCSLSLDLIHQFKDLFQPFSAACLNLPPYLLCFLSLPSRLTCGKVGGHSRRTGKISPWGFTPCEPAPSFCSQTSPSQPDLDLHTGLHDYCLKRWPQNLTIG